MDEFNVEIRYVLRIYYKKGKNATQAAKKNYDVYRPNAVLVRVVQKWFKRFKSSIFDVKDELRSGQPVTGQAYAILKKVKQDRHISSYDIAEELEIDHKTDFTHLKRAGYTKRLILASHIGSLEEI
ncbi:Histone-lysine N-methyltransferase SETMAR [Eumeta japonica]|uniref:Histone-lysine N-methyltransferase SETMAR n=1 Tax=Eumeta variegata TaxID=151549 RepID=A0A4C1XPN9_EUMVA|nr:Histone-lysine N-methyltransferase SETMAR [Eumeta japonica]